MTHLIHLMSLYWNEWGLATEVNFVWASVAINNTTAVQTPPFKLKFLSASALSKIIKAGYAALQLEYFFTAGPDEVRAWTVRVRAGFLQCTCTCVCVRLYQTHTRTNECTECPAFHPAGTLTDITHFQLCHGCALASHYRPRITSITGELLNSESGGYID